MSAPRWLSECQARIQAAGAIVSDASATALAPSALLLVRREGWERAARALAADHRFAALWAEQTDDGFLVNACFEGGRHYFVLRAALPADDPSLPSIAGCCANADRPERHARDLLGVDFTGAPDARRWTRHQAWGAEQHPLRREFPREGRPPVPTPPDTDYPFLQAQGHGVYEIPVGPVHAGVIEPGHFRFQALGEDVLNLEERLGYVHKGVEKIACGRDAAGLLRLAARISGDSAVAHAWAAAMACERAAGVAPPPRALHLRALLAERERIVNHLWDVAAVHNDVAFPFAYYQLGRLVEDWRRLNADLFGHRLLMDCIVPGGVGARVADGMDRHAADLLREQAAALRAEVNELRYILQYNSSLHDRLAGTGVLAPQDAARLGALGFVGRASGVDFDVRRDHPYAPYDKLQIRCAAFPEGDVAARVRARFEEVLASLDLLDHLLSTLPAGRAAHAFTPPEEASEGLGIVDGWRGEIITHVRFDAGGQVRRFFPRDPSWLTWPALEHLIRGNIVPDFPVCNKSVNGSYSGHDL